MNNYYRRPDEIASESQIEENKQTDANFKKAANLGLTLGTTALGVGLSSKVLPFLNEYIPTDLALKGISKVSPQLGNFLKKGMSVGLDIQEGLSFIKDNLMKGSEQKAPEQKNIIEQYDDQLHSFMKDLISKGRSPLEAGALAKISGKFDKSILKMEKENKANFSSIIESVYGKEDQKNKPTSNPNTAPKTPIQAQAPTQTPQGGSIQPELVAALQKIQQAMKG
jgi:hypothetical protein